MANKRAAKRCRIYQIDRVDSEFAFREYGYVLSKGISAPPSDVYKVVFDGQLKTEELEKIFEIFNIAHPKEFSGHSLSVSDIIELYENDNRSFYYCDIFGFKEISFTPIENG